MRKLSFFGLASLFTALAHVGCGGVDTSGPGGSASADGTDVIGQVIDVYRPTTGETTRPDLDSWTTFSALVEKDGVYTTFPGNVDADGKLVIPDVPDGPYLLMLASAPPASLPGAPSYRTFFETSARKLDLGTTYSGRPDTAAMSQQTFLEIDATLTTPWQAYTVDAMDTVTQPYDDRLQLISRNAQVIGSYVAGQSLPEESAPADGAAKLTSWKIDAGLAFSYLGNLALIDGSKGDDLTILHDVQREVGAFDGLDPWQGYYYQTTQEVLRPTAPTMTDGGTSKITGAFEAVKQSSLAIDYKGSAFNALLPGVPLVFAYVDFSLYLEPGLPQPQAGAFATLLDASTSGLTVYSDPACGGDCDPAACPSGCDLGTYVAPGDHAHTYSYGNPFDSGQESVIALIDLRADITKLLPEMTSERLRAHFSVQAPSAEINGKPLQPVLGFPQGIKVAGQATPYDQVTAGVGASPEITWSAPTLGQATSYRVTVVDLTDQTDKNGNVLLRRNIAGFDLTGTSVKIPKGLLEAGKFYYFQVAARAQDSEDRTAPYKEYPIHDAVAQMFTGVVTP